MYKWTSLFAQTGLCAQPADTRISDVTFIKGNHTTVWSTIRHRKACLLFCNYAKLCTLAESRGSVQGCAALCMSAWILPPGDGWNVTLVSGGESYRMSCTHCCTQSDNLFSPIMNMDIFQISHKWVGFVSCPHPQADLAMTCRAQAIFSFSWDCLSPCLISCSLLLRVLYHMPSPITEPKPLSGSYFLLPFCSSHCKSKVTCIIITFVLQRLTKDVADERCHSIRYEMYDKVKIWLKT